MSSPHISYYIILYIYIYIYITHLDEKTALFSTRCCAPLRQVRWNVQTLWISLECSDLWPTLTALCGGFLATVPCIVSGRLRISNERQQMHQLHGLPATISAETSCWNLWSVEIHLKVSTFTTSVIKQVSESRVSQNFIVNHHVPY